jgi:hypothetical protein
MCWMTHFITVPSVYVQMQIQRTKLSFTVTELHAMLNWYVHSHFRSTDVHLLDMQYNHEQVVSDCSACLILQPQNTKALLRRALAYEALEKMQKALDGNLYC